MTEIPDPNDGSEGTLPSDRAGAPDAPDGLADAAPDSVRAAITLLADAGYTADLSPRGGALHCAACGQDHDATGARVDHLFRFEGASDPDDEAIVLGLTCPACGERGVLVSGYGPSTDPDEIDLILSLIDSR